VHAMRTFPSLTPSLVLAFRPTTWTSDPVRSQRASGNSDLLIRLTYCLLIACLSACSRSKESQVHDAAGPVHDAAARDSSTDGAADGSSPGPDLYDTLAGDGSEAFARIAEVWCERAMDCAERFGGPHLWATKDACVLARRSDLHHDGNEIACDGRDDFKVEPKPLAACLRSYGEASCPRIAYDRPFVVEAEYGVFAACRDTSADILEQRDKREGRRGLGQPCRDQQQCGFHFICEIKKEGTCGTCRALPGVGEPCEISSEGDAFCDFAFECDETDHTCTRGVGGEGEAPGPGGCAAGLDLADGRCQDLHREGKACDPATSCGSWLACIDSQCRPLLRGAIGQPCGGGSLITCDESLCTSSGCVDLPGLGDPCAPDTCQAPYACVDGKCAKTPSCGKGRKGDPCEGYWQCGAGLSCFYNRDQPSKCDTSLSDMGERCSKSSECQDGGCIDGTCQRFGDASACDSFRDCLSRQCSQANTCVPALVCE